MEFPRPPAAKLTQITFRLTESERLAIKAAATEHDVTVSEFVRYVAAEAVRNNLAK